MKRRFHTAVLLSLLAFSFIFIAPVTVNANGDFQEPDLGDLDRIEFMDSTFEIILDNDTRIDLASSLIFDDRVAYLTINTSNTFSESSPFTDEYSGLIYTGVQNGSDRVYLRTNASVKVNQLDFAQDAYVHLILWDHSKSLITFLQRLNTAFATNDSTEFLKLLLQLVFEMETVLDGDEVLIITPVFFWQLDYDLDYNITNRYYIDDENNGPDDEIQAGEGLNFTGLPSAVRSDLIQKAQDEDPNLEYLMNDSAGATQGSWSHFFYLIQEIWFKKLYMDLRIPAGFVYDVDIVSVRHLLWGAALYNDTDANGLMDVAFNETGNGNYYPYSTEAVCGIELINATDVVFGTPVVDEANDELSWNATIKSPWVRLNPYGQSAETGILVGAPEVPMDDCSFGFTFAPQVHQASENQISLEGLMKIDQTIGAINGSDGLKGLYENLDLAVIYISDVFEIQAQQQLSASTPQSNASVKNADGDPVSATVSTTTEKTESLDFFIGSTRVSGLDLASENYSIAAEDENNPTHVANGAVIPYGIYRWSVDQTGEAVSQKGIVDWNLSADVSYSTYIYEVCYPDYNGSKIVHDPTYIIYGDVTYPESGIPGFELYTVIFGLSIIGCIAAILKKKKVSFKI